MIKKWKEWKGKLQQSDGRKDEDDANVFIYIYKLRKGILFFVKAIKIVYDYHNLI